jgi:aminopeptidase-like protein
MYRIMNESFRLFIQSAEHAEEIAEWEKREQQSTWHAFRYVMIGGAIGGMAWLLYSQAAFTQVVAGSIAAIVTLLTAVTSLFGRSGRQPSPAAKDTQ